MSQWTDSFVQSNAAMMSVKLDEDTVSSNTQPPTVCNFVCCKTYKSIMLCYYK
jgi:hypothetical protein